MSIPTEAATLAAPPQGDDDDVVGTTSKKEFLATFKGALEDGLHNATVVDMKPISGPNKFKPGETREQCVWLLQVDGKEDQGELAWYTSFSLHEKSKLPGTLVAFQKPAPAVGDGLRKSVYVGSKCQVLIENQPGKTDPSKMFPRIEKLLKRKAA